MGTFRDYFGRKNDEIDFPAALKSMLLKKLKLFDEYEYVDVKDSHGKVVLTRKDRKDINFELNIEKLPDEIDGLKITKSNVFDVSYVTQKPISIGNPEVKLNNTSGKFSELMVQSMDVENIGDFTIVPAPFPKIDEPFVIEIGGEKIDFMIERIPFASLSKSKYQNTNHKYFSLIITINEHDNNDMDIDVSLNFDINKIETIKEVVELKNVILGFFEKNIHFKGVKKSLINKSEDTDIDRINEVIQLYEKFYELESALGVSFKNDNPFTNKNMKLFKKAYVCTTKRKWIQFPITEDSSVRFESTQRPEELVDYQKMKQDFVYKSIEEKTDTLFGVDLTYDEISISEDLHVEEIIEDINKWSIKCKYNTNGRRLKYLKFQMIDFDIDRYPGAEDVISLESLDW